MTEKMLAFAVLCSLCVWTLTVDAKALLIQDWTEDNFKRPDVSTPVPLMTTVPDTMEAPSKGPHVSTPSPMMTLVQNTLKTPLKGPSVSTPVPLMTLVQDTSKAPSKGPSVSTPVNRRTLAQDTTEAPSKGPSVSTLVPMMTLVQDTTKAPLKGPHVSTPAPIMTLVEDTTEAPSKGPSVSTLVPMVTPVPDTKEAPSKGPHIPTPGSMMTLVQDTTEAPSKGPSVSTPVPMVTPVPDTVAVPEANFKPQNMSINATVKSPGVTMQVSLGHYKLSSISLGMASDSVDDMYHGCSDKMLIKVKRNFLRESSKKEALFSKVTERCATQALRVKDSYDSLSWDHLKALCAYTASAYTDLNEAVRKSKTTYSTTFEFHALHFLLADAIQRLKQNQRNCYTSYRRSKREFVGEVGQTMRFGSFASSSLSTDLEHFGRKTCFEIRTCFGAFLKSYTEFGADEQEVLIPPYEMFTIVSVDRSGKNHLLCDTLYKLQTAGIHSSLNCQVAGLT